MISYHWQHRAFDIATYLLYALILMATLGVSFISPSYAETLEFAIKLYVCVFLVWRFHPFRTRPHFTELDYKISFNAGMIILMTTILNAYLKMEPNLPAELKKKRVDGKVKMQM